MTLTTTNGNPSTSAPYNSNTCRQTAKFSTGAPPEPQHRMQSTLDRTHVDLPGTLGWIHLATTPSDNPTQLPTRLGPSSSVHPARNTRLDPLDSPTPHAPCQRALIYCSTLKLLVLGHAIGQQLQFLAYQCYPLHELLHLGARPPLRSKHLTLRQLEAPPPPPPQYLKHYCPFHCHCPHKPPEHRSMPHFVPHSLLPHSGPALRIC